MPPTIVLVHGAFAESASWDRVVDALLDAGASTDRWCSSGTPTAAP